MEELRYPLGRFDPGREPTPKQRPGLIDEIASLPAALRAATSGLVPDRLDKPYREGGWTVRQVVHHVPDSHLNAYVRFKLALTEDNPLIRTYEEGRWAELADTAKTPIDVSLTLLDALHERWTTLLRAMTDEQWRRTLRHPDWGTIPLTTMLALYVWHGKHHVAHVTSLRKRNGW